jgi:hypothetical protein
MEYYSEMQMNQVLIYVTAWMNLENMMLNKEARQ